jgi:hypothetical protein
MTTKTKNAVADVTVESIVRDTREESVVSDTFSAIECAVYLQDKVAKTDRDIARELYKRMHGADETKSVTAIAKEWIALPDSNAWTKVERDLRERITDLVLAHRYVAVVSVDKDKEDKPDFGATLKALRSGAMTKTFAKSASIGDDTRDELKVSNVVETTSSPRETKSLDERIDNKLNELESLMTKYNGSLNPIKVRMTKILTDCNKRQQADAVALKG